MKHRKASLIWLAAIMGLGVALSVTLGASSSVSSGDISPLQTSVRGQTRWLAGGPAALRVIVTNHDTGAPLGAVSHAIQMEAEGEGFSVVREYVGHGIGREMHEEPQVPNFGPPDRGPILRKGMVLAIEPMVNAGSYEVKVLEDRWTAVTKDGRPSAHFEHSIVVADGEAEILSLVSMKA